MVKDITNNNKILNNNKTYNNMKTFEFSTAAVNDKVDNYLNDLSTEHTEISEYVNSEDIEDYDNVFDFITEKLQDNNSLDVDVIYYSRAIAYLSENDASLNESLRIASELGFSTENLNSEILASLLASENNREQWQEKEDEINTFFEELEQEIEDYKSETIDLLVEVGEDYDEASILELDELTEKANELSEEINKLYN